MSKACIIIPCYNESNRLLVNDFLAFLNQHNNFSFIFIDDGSSDNTIAILNKLSEHPQISCYRTEDNKGKAEAVRYGIQKTINDQHDYYGFIDADLAIPLDELLKLYNELDTNSNLGLVYCSKNNKVNNQLEMKFKRLFVGRALSKMVKWSLKIDVYDTQCGCKMMTKEVAEVAFNKQFISAWLFDIEIFWRLIVNFGKNYIANNTKEIPLTKLYNRGSSKVSIGALIKLPLEFLKIHNHYKKELK